MTIQKVKGCSEGFYITIGDYMFACVYAWPYGQHKDQSHHNKSLSPQPKGSMTFGLVCYAFKPLNGDWILRMNDGGSMYKQLAGRLLNSINLDKRIRLPYEQFKPLVESTYRDALISEANSNFLI